MRILFFDTTSSAFMNGIVWVRICTNSFFNLPYKDQHSLGVCFILKNSLYVEINSY